MKKRKNLYLSSSSYLIPKNLLWNKINGNYNVYFSEYADFSLNTDINKVNDILINFLFLEDICNFYLNDFKKSKQALKIFINTLIKRLKISKNYTMVFFFTPSNDNELNFSTQLSLENKVHNWFYNELLILSKKYDSFYIIDLNTVFSKKGYNNYLSSRNWYFARSHLSLNGINKLVSIINNFLERFQNSSKKILVLDCDNTIWGGVLGEDGILGVKIGLDGIGNAYIDFQKEIKKLSRKGILIALCSKNEESEVIKFINSNKSMIIKKKDLVTWRINWKEKYQNIIEISKELNLSLGSFVFWDDSPVERNKMKINLPEVTTIEMPEDVIDWPNYLRKLIHFSSLKVLNEDKQKIKQYQIRSKFYKDKYKQKNEYAYLKSIQLKPKIIKINQNNINRAHQLIQKTNQFNLTLNKENKEYLKKFTNSKYGFLFSLKDIYGDHGIVGLVCLKKIDNSSILIDNFLMSCRVIGRYLEYWAMNEVIKILRNNNFKYIVGYCNEIKTNRPIHDFLKKCGFKKIKIKLFNESFIEYNNDKSKKFLFNEVKNINLPHSNIYG